MHLDEETVVRATDSLREKKLVHSVDRSDSRVTKYRHVLYEAMNLGRPAIAVMCVLMLRGAQTVGEIRTRTNRLYDFGSLEQVGTTLNALMTASPPLIARLSRQTGQQEVRYAHRLPGEVQLTPVEVEMETEREIGPDRISMLEKEVADLRREFEEFRRKFE